MRASLGVLFLFLPLLLSMAVIPAYADSLVFGFSDSSLLQGDTFNVGLNNADNTRGLYSTVSKAFTVTRITVTLSQVNGPGLAGTATGKLYSTTGSPPNCATGTATLIATSTNSLDEGTPTAAPTLKTFTFSGTKLTSGNVYIFAIRSVKTAGAGTNNMALPLNSAASTAITMVTNDGTSGGAFTSANESTCNGVNFCDSMQLFGDPPPATVGDNFTSGAVAASVLVVIIMIVGMSVIAKEAVSGRMDPALAKNMMVAVIITGLVLLIALAAVPIFGGK